MSLVFLLSRPLSKMIAVHSLRLFGWKKPTHIRRKVLQASKQNKYI